MRKVVAWVACAFALSVFAVRVVIPAARDPLTAGFATCYAEARILLEDPRQLARVYQDGWFQQRVDRALGHHVEEIAQGQPPTMSLILAPVAWLSPGQARAVWIALSTLLWAAGIAVLARALAVRPLHGVPPAVWIAAAATLFSPITDNLVRGQAYPLLFFLLCLVARSILRRPAPGGWPAGIPLGLMLILKSAGLWLWPLLAGNRRGRIVLLAALATVAVVVAASSALMGWAIWPLYLRESLRWLATEPSNHVTSYQTVQSLAGHLFVREPVWNPSPVTHLPVLAKALSVLIIGALFGVSLRCQRLDSPWLASRALTVGMFIAPLVAVAPIGEGYHYVLVFPAVMIGFWWARRAPATETGRLRAWCLVAGCTALICVPLRCYGSPHLRDGWLALLAYPRVYGSLALWALLARALSTDDQVVNPRHLSG